MPARQGRTSMIGKLGLSAFLLTMAGTLFWYGVCSHRIAALDTEFMEKSPSARLFPEAWRLKGRIALRKEVNAEAAVVFFRHAISVQPVMIDAWLDLARAELSLGGMEPARKIADLLEREIPHVSNWKWDELLLAYDLRRDDYFSLCFNFILNRLPARASEACYLATRYWGGWAEVLPHMSPANHVAFLNELMRARQPEVALALWNTMEESSGSVAGSSGIRGASARDVAAGSSEARETLALRFCQFLMDCGRLVEAKAVWTALSGEGAPVIADGGFEQPPLNQAFGWRFDRHPEVGIERSPISPGAGQSSLHLHFQGSRNVTFHHVSRVVAVEPGQSYVLRFLRKSSILTTDQGVFLEVSGYQCKGLAVQSMPVTGSVSWAEERVQFTVPKGCQAVLLQVRRKASLSFDNKISGDYWLDRVSMERDDTIGGA
jgi:hypothetical protein